MMIGKHHDTEGTKSKVPTTINEETEKKEKEMHIDRQIEGLKTERVVTFLRTISHNYFFEYHSHTHSTIVLRCFGLLDD